MLNTFKPNKKQHIFLRTHGSKIAHCGNRTGKTTMLAYEAALHATREYPHWWSGIEFEKEKTVSILVVGQTYALIYDTILKAIAEFTGQDYTEPFAFGIRIKDYVGLSLGNSPYRLKFLSADLSEDDIKSEVESFSPDIVFCDDVYEYETIDAIKSVVGDAVHIIQAFTPYKFEYCSQTPTVRISMLDCAFIDQSLIDGLMCHVKPHEFNMRVFGEQ